jgi:hypothetical protein
MRHLKSTNIQAEKEALLTLVEESYKEVAKAMGKVLPNKFPIRIEASSDNDELTHLHYDVHTDGNKRRIKYLKPTALTIDLGAIVRLYERLGMESVPFTLLIKTVEVITVHQFYHVDLHSPMQFDRNTTAYGILMGHPEIESKCFSSTRDYYSERLDIAGVHIANLLYLLYNEDIGNHMDDKNIAMNIKSSLWEVKTAITLMGARMIEMALA